MQSFTSRVPRHLQTKLVIFACLFGLGVLDGAAQSVEVRLSIKQMPAARVGIEIKSEATRSWSFRNSYGNILGLSNRIQNIRGRDSQGATVPVLRDAPGEFRSSADVSEISYEVSLTRPMQPADLSRVSWLDSEFGLLMLGDLLPQQKNQSIDLTVDLPDSWSAEASFDPVENGRYRIENPEKAVFLVGKSIRHKRVRLRSGGFRFITIGTWPFDDSAAMKVTEKLMAENTRILHGALPGDSAVMLLPWPGVSTADRWTAETRGSAVVLLMGTDARRNAALNRLKVVLAHELFHLWVPNALKLRGDYDWFFEGFTVYQALLTALRLNYIKFEDYLETLSRVYDSYRSSTERDKLSLLEASERRWTTTSSIVYDRGVLVAFLYDLRRRRHSGGRATMSDVYPEVLRKASGQDGSELLMMILNGREGMEGFSEKFVKSPTEIDLKSFLPAFGLQLEGFGSRSKIRVAETINPEQRRLLKTLRYKG